ncbi:uncharacterized protein PG998_013607 [Apiospora kogelbergensis]|uniref:uncharacterized protein n=1 Tax=Apiospora kogelbergensis TaxID=1337665 RepID=UPI003131344C
MTLRNTPVDVEEEDGNGDDTKIVMCEMYSTRMRDLYLLCNGTEQAVPDPKPLFEFVARRRRVFTETVLPIRKMLLVAQLELAKPLQSPQETPIFTSSTTGINRFQIEQIRDKMGSSCSNYIYSSSGLTMRSVVTLEQLQAQATASGLVAEASQVDMLEQWWRSVE